MTALMTAKRSEGCTKVHTNASGSAMTIGQVYEIDGEIGILKANKTDPSDLSSVPNGEDGEFAIDEVWQVPKENGQVWKGGDELFWDTTNDQATRFGYGLFPYLGIVYEAATETAAVGYVHLNKKKHFDNRRFEFLDDFRGITSPPATASADGGRWSKADTSSGGAPTLTTVDSDTGGAIKLLLAATSEIENLCLYHGDIKSFDIDDDLVFESRFKIADIAASTMLAIGMAGNRNDALDSVAQHAWFRQEAAALDLLVETDDGTTDDDDNDTTTDLVDDTYIHVAICFRSTGDVMFYINGVRTLAATTFDMSAYTGKLQPLVQLQKTAATATPSVTVDFIRITGTRS